MDSQIETRLSGHDTTDSLRDEIEAIVEEMVNKHYEQIYEGDVCESCHRMDYVPDQLWGPLSDMYAEVEELATFADEILGEFDGETHSLKPEIRGTYFDFFYERSVGPADCAVCTAEVVDEDILCGHWEKQETCPVRGEPP
jgi:hypothetical protein